MINKRGVCRPAIVRDSIALIPLGKDSRYGFAIVDKDMAWLAEKYKWTISNKGKYACTGTYDSGNGIVRHVYLHRVIVGLNVIGIVDHISRDTMDNRRSNLRIVDSRINQLNTKHRGGTSQYRGVCWDKRNKRWVSKLKNNGTWHNFGYFINEIDAAKAYNEGAIKYFGKYASLNDV